MTTTAPESSSPSAIDPATGLQFFDLSNPWGHNAPLWPYFPDVKIERFHYHAKSGVLSQQITTFMHCTTHSDAPAHVIEGTPFIDEVPLSSYFGTGVVVSIPKEKWEVITAADFENATPEIREGDIVIVNTVQETALALAQELVANSQVSISGNKQALRTLLDVKWSLEPDVEQALMDLRRASFASEELREGVRAFSEKRRPRWRRMSNGP